MVQRLSHRENEKPGDARKRFDGQLDVRAWTVPGSEDKEPEPRDPKAPWWWDASEAEQSAQEFMTMALARGMIE
ncbi:hypothetical protein QBA54_07335 [Streptomyces sp. B21-108]|jgi:hypothetical protein|uniref:hypothetical protein n=1 Tax=Streptomyces sp. B21-108 TaxID=3039419 RepID=UPI002FEFD22A